MEISTQLQEQLSLRQKCMCGQCGKKIDEIEGAEKVFIALNASAANNPTLENSVLICNYCNNETKQALAEPNYDLKKLAIDLKRGDKVEFLNREIGVGS